MIVGCGNLNPDNVQFESNKVFIQSIYVKNNIGTIDRVRIYNYIIDSCEYIGTIDHYDQFIAHKGNCKFCKIRNNGK